MLAGFRPKLEEDNDISFKVGNKEDSSTAFLEIEETNPNLFKLALPRIYEIEKKDMCLALDTLKSIETLGKSTTGNSEITLIRDDNIFTLWISTGQLSLEQTKEKDLIKNKIHNLLETRESIDRLLYKASVTTT